jgi:hypothetical protein
VVRFVETPIFTEDVSNELSLDDYRQMQVALMLRPELGPVVPGSGAIRKMRWRRAGMGKRGGLRVIYFWEAKSETFYMLTVYRKSDQEDLSLRQRRILRRLVEEEFK